MKVRQYDSFFTLRNCHKDCIVGLSWQVEYRFSQIRKEGLVKLPPLSIWALILRIRGKKVLLVDFDPQANLSSSIGIRNSDSTIYDAIVGDKSLDDVLHSTALDNLTLIPSSINLTGANVELIKEKNREFFLKNLLYPRLDQWDYIFIDCPPSLGLLTLNGLTAAHQVIIPLQCEFFALEGLSMLLQTIKRIQGSFNAGLEIGGILFTMFDSRTRLANEVVQEVTGYFGDKVFRTIIPRNIRLSEAPSHGFLSTVMIPIVPARKVMKNLRPR